MRLAALVPRVRLARLESVALARLAAWALRVRPAPLVPPVPPGQWEPQARLVPKAILARRARPDRKARLAMPAASGPLARQVLRAKQAVPEQLEPPARQALKAWPARLVRRAMPVPPGLRVQPVRLDNPAMLALRAPRVRLATRSQGQRAHKASLARLVLRGCHPWLQPSFLDR